jgi:hypothetical protein
MLDVDPTRGAFAIVLQDSEGGIECPIEAYMNTVDAPMDDLRIKMAFGDIRDAVIEVMRKHSEDGSIVYRNKNKTYVSRKRQ